MVRDPLDLEYRRSVTKKAKRMARARSTGGFDWRNLAHVGVLGWLFVLPIVLGGLGGRALAKWLDQPALAISGLAVGLFAGGYITWRHIQRSIAHDDEEEES